LTISKSLSGAKKLKKKAIKKEKKPKKIKKGKIEIGPTKLTRFERARIIGARALQLSFGAPPFIPISPDISDPIKLAVAELDVKVLPISIRRTLSDGKFQDIPIDWLT
jgi:DNA-directed RNA polymerase I, II, and III subunit RPABC2